MPCLAFLPMTRPRKRSQPVTGLGEQQAAIEARLRSSLPGIVQREREARGLTQEQLAEKAGVHWTTVGKIERGRQTPSISLLAVLAEALGCTAMDLLQAALPRTPVASEPGDEDRTVSYVRSLPGAEREGLLQVLEALESWKGGRRGR